MVIRTDLSGGWVLHATDPALRIRGVPATVPGCVHTDLLAAGLIPDPYLDENEHTLAWIGRTTWLYERHLDHIAVAGEHTVLCFEGLDTVATVSVNGDVVATTENMHRRHEIPVDLQPGRNVLSIRFDPAETFATMMRGRPLPNAYPAPFNHVRKMACNFGWDWGPALVTAGIWRPVSLLRHRGARLRSVRPRVTMDGAQGTVAFDVTAAGADLEVEAGVGSISVTQPSAEHGTVTVHLDRPRRWWPHDLGDQPLYDAWVRLRQGGDVVDEWHQRIGFRTVRLDTTPHADGTPFVLVVNDVPVPVRGANWIPDDCFPSRVTPGRLRQRIGQAVAANVNLLRVWGGGTYESRDFYRTCDERGVLVWQDFLFACAAYPEDERLVREVEAEARDNVARLMPHPSLVLWNGNNENIWGWFDWDWQSTLDGRPWGLGYYLDLLPRVVREVDPTRPYWPGSPYSGTMDVHPNDDDHGTSHVWDVWNEKDYLAYRGRRPRFVAEFGWQAPPAWSTLTRAVHDDPLTPDSPGLRSHQKAAGGAGKLTRGLAPHLPAPESFVDWHFAMQLNQARAIRVGIEHFRSLRPRCSGTIVWQLNDCWPVISWSAIDGDGRMKPLWYALRAAYAARLLTIQPSGRGLHLYGVNDTVSEWVAPVTVRRLTFDGEELGSAMLELRVAPLGVSSVELPVAASDPATLLVAGTGGERTVWFFAEDRDLPYRPATWDISRARDRDDVLVTVRAATLVRDLCLFPDRIDPAAEADDALITLLPGEERLLRVRGVPLGREDELLTAPVLRTANDLIHTVHRG